MIQRVEAGRELGKGALAELGKSLPDLVTQGVSSILLEATNVVEFDSQTLEGVLEFDALARSRGLEVVIARPSTVLLQALEITGLAERLEIRRDADDEGMFGVPEHAAQELPVETRLDTELDPVVGVDDPIDLPVVPIDEDEEDPA